MKTEEFGRKDLKAQVRRKPAAAAFRGPKRRGNSSGIDKPSWAGTTIFLVFLGFTAVTIQPGVASEIAGYAARGAACGLALLLLLELWNGWRQCFRADLLMLGGIYFLTLFEFLFDQPKIDGLISGHAAMNAVHACFAGYAGVALGRHYAAPVHQGLARMLKSPAPTSLVFQMLIFAFVGGFFYMMATVAFNPVRFFDAIMGPRFSQPWTRGQFGDWKALLYETSMLIYLVPPLAGVILGRFKRYPTWQIVATVSMLLFTLFYGFTTGIRNVFAIYVLGCLAGYAFILNKKEQRKILIAGILAVILLLVSTTMILNFRNYGLRDYLARSGTSDAPERTSEVFVDYNLWAIGVITDNFPANKDFLLLEVPYITLVRPIPRAIWPGKPEGLSVDPAELAGIGGQMTMAATFIGEAYMSLGIVGVIFGGFFFGAFARWWVRQVGTYQSDWSVLVYASGMFTISITLRSSMQFTTAVLPTVLLLLVIYFFTRRSVSLQTRGKQPRVIAPINP